MKYYFLSIILFSVQLLSGQFISTDDYYVKNTIKDYNLKGNIKEVTTTAKDKNGNWATLPFQENEFYNQFTLKFSSNGLLSQRINYLDYKGKLGIYNYIDYSYQKNNVINSQITTIVNNGEDPLLESSNKLFIYDSEQKLKAIREVVKSKNSTTDYETEFLYANQLKEVITKVNNTKSNTSQYFYNSSGNLIQVKNLSFDGKVGLSKYFIYDNGTPIYKEESYHNRKIVHYYDIDKSSNLKVFNEKLQLDYQLVFNENKDIISIKKRSFSNQKSLLKEYHVTYIYDKFGNWIEANITLDHENAYTINRNIIYY